MSVAGRARAQAHHPCPKPPFFFFPSGNNINPPGAVFRAPRSEDDGSKREVIQITFHSLSTRLRILTKCVVAHATFDQQSPHPGVVAGTLSMSPTLGRT